jgi:hypothetical protein
MVYQYYWNQHKNYDAAWIQHYDENTEEVIGDL